MHMCRLAALFKQEGMEVAMFSTHWFNTLFAYCLPFPHLLRLWDIFMLEGMKVGGRGSFPWGLSCGV